MDGPAQRNWVGLTLPEWSKPGSPHQGDGAHWSKGCGTGLNMRSPGYSKSNAKVESNGSLYECLSVDVISSTHRLEDVLGRLAPVPVNRSGLRWSEGCPLPRIICINVQLPYKVGPMKGAHPLDDAGCSVIAIFQLRPETLAMLDTDNAPPHFRLFRRFLEGPAGRAGGPLDDPKRSLGARRNNSKNATNDSGLFKLTASGDNADEAGLPSMLKGYNGKPCLVTKSGTVVKDKRGEWLEIGIDVREFSWLAKSSLYSFRDKLPKARVHVGFYVQGVEDDELPEGLIGDCRLHYLSLSDAVRHIDDGPQVSRHRSIDGFPAGPPPRPPPACWNGCIPGCFNEPHPPHRRRPLTVAQGPVAMQKYGKQQRQPGPAAVR